MSREAEIRARLSIVADASAKGLRMHDAETDYLVADLSWALSRIEELKKDAERLDWLQENTVEVFPVLDMDPEAKVGWLLRPYDAPSVEGEKLRDAIDAAIAKVDQ